MAKGDQGDHFSYKEKARVLVLPSLQKRRKAQGDLLTRYLMYIDRS